ncbi:RNA methyltransferase [Flavobacteriaceae bacterium]|nr:RNA methyltransferase [Flavobacteriaceae bacterium]
MRKLKNKELDRIDVETFKRTKKTPLIVILDDIRSLNNIGSVFRSSDAFLIEKVYLCGITACPPHKDIHKTALGATESVDWEYRENALDLVKELQKEGVIVAAIEQADQSVFLNKVRFDQSKRYAIVMGNEVKGVQQEIVTQADLVIEIPQLGTKHSLNISVSTGILLWDIFRNFQEKA